ncbi:hypothetical protein HKX48_009343 [Thoreauomyces humboldtii]|nr:hypothetical protein HKX48_009343 [Thoreauomyces humboldtii]
MTQSSAGYMRLPLFVQETLYSKNKAKRQFVTRTLGLTFAFNVLWFLSLEGKVTPEEMNVTIGKLGVYMLLAELCLTSLLWLFCTHLRQWPRRIALAAVPLNLYLWYLYDHGNILMSHGAFNMLIFFMIGVPLNLVIATLYLWHRSAGSWRAFGYQFLFVWAFIFTWNFFSMRRSYRLLDVGFWELTGNSGCAAGDVAGHCRPDQCVWDKPYPWIDLLAVPQNFFLGPMTCPKLDHFSATIDPATNILTVVGCPATETTYLDSYFSETRLETFRGPAVSYLPNTETWGYEDKEDNLLAPYNNFQRKVLTYVEGNSHAYPQGGLDIGDTQTVLVRCGLLEPKLVYRVKSLDAPAPPTAKAPVVVEEKGQDGELNVVFVFLDAVSRRHFFRKMQKTVKTMERFAKPGVVDTPDESPVLHQFFRYHAIGLNTGPNTRALWSDIPSNDKETGATPIWEDFHKDGYVTGRMDGVCEDWNAFYNTAHFPTKELKTVPAAVSHEMIAFSCLPPYLPVGKGFAGNFAGSTSMKAHCLSGQHIGWHMLDWLDIFVKEYYEKKSKFFVTGVFLEGHEGSTEVIKTLDDRLSAFLDPSTSNLDYNNTAVFVQADHGLHMGLNYIFFDNGHVEEVQPFSGVILPAWYTRKHGDRIKDNQDRLVTAHDFWATMQGMRGAAKARKSTAGGRDLVREDVGDRSCETLGIDPEACRCNVKGQSG